MLLSKTALPAAKGALGSLNFISLEALLAIFNVSLVFVYGSLTGSQRTLLCCLLNVEVQPGKGRVPGSVNFISLEALLAIPNVSMAVCNLTVLQELR